MSFRKNKGALLIFYVISSSSFCRLSSTSHLKISNIVHSGELIKKQMTLTESFNLFFKFYPKFPNPWLKRTLKN